MRREKGITLVALVVTIIVLLILAGITLNLMIGQDGIITKAQEAGRTQKIAEIKEKIGLAILDAQTEARIRGEQLEQEQVKDIISQYGELQEDGDTIKLKDIDAEVSVKDIYNGTTSNTGSYTANKEKIEQLENQVKGLQEQLDNASLSGNEKDSKIAELNERIKEIEDKKSQLELEIENGKTAVATAISNRGIETSKEDSFETIAENISKITSDAKVVRASATRNWTRGYYTHTVYASEIGLKYIFGVESAVQTAGNAGSDGNSPNMHQDTLKVSSDYTYFTAGGWNSYYSSGHQTYTCIGVQ